jgi:hypothetical protein
MNSLINVMSSLSEARTNKDAAQDLWLAALENGSEDQATLKQAFHYADAIWTSGAQTLETAISELRSIFCFEVALSLLDREQLQTLHKLVADFHLDNLTDPYQNPELPRLAETWYSAEGMHEAAKTVYERFANRDQDETIESILADLDQARKPEAWAATAKAYDFLYTIQAETTDESGAALASSVLVSLHRLLLKQYDDLTAKLADKLEDAYYGGNVSEVLEDLEPDICRVIQNALSSGLIRQRQAQPEDQHETRNVIDILEQEDEADAEQ